MKFIKNLKITIGKSNKKYKKNNCLNSKLNITQYIKSFIYVNFFDKNNWIYNNVKWNLSFFYTYL